MRLRWLSARGVFLPLCVSYGKCGDVVLDVAWRKLLCIVWCRPLFLTGDWGDIPQDLVLSLNTPTQLGVYWTNPSSRSLPPTQ